MPPHSPQMEASAPLKCRWVPPPLTKTNFPLNELTWVKDGLCIYSGGQTIFDCDTRVKVKQFVRTIAFKIKNYIEGQGQSPQTNKDLNQGVLHLWSKFGDPSLNRWNENKLMIDTGTHTQTQATTIPEGQNWSWVKRTLVIPWGITDVVKPWIR